MKRTVVPNDLGQRSVSNDQGEHPSHGATLPTTPVALSDMALPVRSYQPHAWSFLNSILDRVDETLPGRAGQLQRLVSYLFFGGTAAAVNLLAFGVVFYLILPVSLDEFVHKTLAYIVAAELSILANFLPNDRFTFRALPGAQRPWLQRCLRFHATCIVGTILTYLIMLVLTHVKTPEILAEAFAIMIVLIYNFTFHHLFTYRHIAEAH